MTTWTQFCPFLTTTYLHVDIFKLEHGQNLAFFEAPTTIFCPRSHWMTPYSSKIGPNSKLYFYQGPCNLKPHTLRPCWIHKACNSIIVLRLVGSSVTQGNSLMMTWSFNKTFFKEDAKRIWRQPLWNSIWNLLIYFGFWKYDTFGRPDCTIVSMVIEFLLLGAIII